LKVIVAPADVGGCGFYRLIAPTTVLQKMGLDVEIDYQSQNQRAKRRNGRIVAMEPTGHDVMVIQRPIFSDIIDAIPLIQANGTKVVIELDDDYWTIERTNTYLKDLQNHGVRTSAPRTLAKACELADLVTVSTPELAKLIPNDNVAVLRNCVPDYYLGIEADHGTGWDLTEGKKVVGWTGNTQTHVGDLERVGYSLRTAVRKNDAKFFCIGSVDAWAIAGFNEGEALYSDWVELIEYPKAVKTFDIGIVPLKMSRFNHCKSYLKGLEYAALGIPFVASPTEEYKHLAKQGVGLLAPDKHDWLKQLNRLLTSDNTDFIEGGREFARENTYERNAWKWAEAWESTLKT